jgi:Tol biopolymer transport system component
MLAGVAGMVGLVGLGAWTLLRRPDTATQPADPIVVRPFGAALSGLKSVGGFSPDGNAIVMAWDGGQLSAPTNVYAMLLDSGKPLRLTNSPYGESEPFYSSDGRKVFFTRRFNEGPVTFSVPALGGDETRVADGTGLCVSDDGQWLLVLRHVTSGSPAAASGTFAVRLSGGEERQLLPPATDFNTGAFDFSPDGTWVYFSQAQVGAPSRAMRLPFAGGPPEEVALPSIASQVSRILSVTFFGRNAGMAVRALDKATNAPRTYLLRADGTRPVSLPRSVRVGAISPDGRRSIAVVGYGISPLYRAPAFPARGEAAVPEKMLDSPRYEVTPRIAPDGAHMVLSSSRSGGSRLWLWDAALADGRPLFDRVSAVTGSPNWSPDGRWIAFDARVKTNIADIWVVASSGGTATQLTDGPAEEITPCFDATGEWVYFTSNHDGDQQIYKVARTGGPQTRVTRGGGFNCQISPDGAFIYYLQSRERGGLWRQELATGKEEPVLPDYRNRNFRVLADGIYLIDVGANPGTSLATQRPGTARFYRLATKTVETLGFTTPRPINAQGIDLSPDRKWVYFSMVDAQASDLQIIENLPFPGDR